MDSALVRSWSCSQMYSLGGIKVSICVWGISWLVDRKFFRKLLNVFLWYVIELKSSVAIEKKWWTYFVLTLFVGISQGIEIPWILRILMSSKHFTFISSICVKLAVMGGTSALQKRYRKVLKGLTCSLSFIIGIFVHS